MPSEVLDLKRGLDQEKMVNMPCLRNIKALVVVSSILLILFLLVDRKIDIANGTYLSKASIAKTVEENAKNKVQVRTLETVVQSMENMTKKMKATFENETNSLTKKIADSASELTKMKQLLETYQNDVNIKNYLQETNHDIPIPKVGVSNVGVPKVSSQDIAMKPFMGRKIVHFDLKGSPPKLNYLIDVMKYSKQFGADGFLVEYEDMFPWDQELDFLRSKNAYSKDDIAKILEVAKDENLIVVPLIQTFGHFEFVLKHSKMKHLRADKDITNVICPINNGSVPLIKKMIAQILSLHPNAEFIHLGGDEVYSLTSCEKCRKSRWDGFKIYTHHMIPLLEYTKTKKTSQNMAVQPIIWDDMLRGWDLNKLKLIGKYVSPMVWAYVPNLNTFFPKDMWNRYDQAFSTIWIASSFKGARSPWTNFVPIKHHLENHLSWLKMIASHEKLRPKIVGIALTGWSRFDHYGPLCELLPVAIPSLAVCLTVLVKGKFDSGIHQSVSKKLEFSRLFQIEVRNFNSYKPEIAKYPVGGKIYQLVGSLENAITRYQPTKSHYLNGWFRPYNRQRKFLSLFHLKHVLSNLNVYKSNYDSLRRKASQDLSPLFDKDTVNEWIEDKIGHYDKPITELLDSLRAIIAGKNFK